MITMMVMPAAGLVCHKASQRLLATDEGGCSAGGGNLVGKADVNSKDPDVMADEDTGTPDGTVDRVVKEGNKVIACDPCGKIDAVTNDSVKTSDRVAKDGNNVDAPGGKEDVKVDAPAAVGT